MRKITVRLLHYFRGSSAGIVLSSVSSALAAALAILIPYLAGKAVDHITEAGEVDISYVVRLVLIISATVLMSSVFRFISARLNCRISYDVISRIRNDAYGKVKKLPVSSIDRNGPGALQSMIISDIETAGDGMMLFLDQTFAGVTTILFTLVIMLVINPKTALFVIVFTPVSFIVSYLIASRSFGSFRRQSQIRSEQTSYIAEMTRNFRLIHIFHTQKRITERFDGINGEYRKASLKSVFLSSITNPSSRFINALIYAGVAFIGSFDVLSSAVTIGSLVSLLAYSSQFMKPFNDLSSVYTELSDSFACLSRVFELLDREELDEDLTSEPGELFRNEDLEIEFRNVSFSYVKGQQVLSDISFKIPAGCSCAIVGPTGCGKTTLINLLMRFYEPDSGTILINGKDISTVPRNTLRSSIGVVTQDTWFKNGRIMDNIKYGKKEMSDEDAVGVSKLSGAHSFIKKMPYGYNERIDSSREDISEGQRQLLGITRAMASDRSILILDEATSSVDILTEVKIQKAVKKMLSDRTSLVIAHRLSTIADADMIVVMESGRISEIGTHKELLKNNGAYARLYGSYIGG